MKKVLAFLSAIVLAAGVVGCGSDADSSSSSSEAATTEATTEAVTEAETDAETEAETTEAETTETTTGSDDAEADAETSETEEVDLEALAEITVVTLVVPQNTEPIIFGYFITNALAGLGIHCGQTIERLSIQSLCGCSIHIIVNVLQNRAHCAILILQILIGQRQNFTSWQAAFIQHPLFCNRNGNPAICFGCTNYKRAVDGGMGCQ